jgi:PPOX class probable F420-dependent enzyme
MKVLTAVLAILLTSTSATARAGQAPAPTPAQIRTAAFDVMKAARYCTLVTLGADGQPQARVVDPLVSADETSIWIATNPLTRKVKEIARDPRVTLLFFNQAKNEYVTVLGRARVVTAAAERTKHWKAEWAPFYKDQARGDDFLLFEVRPFRLEVDSAARGMVNDAKTWRPVTLALDGSRK